MGAGLIGSSKCWGGENKIALNGIPKNNKLL